jgi:hypothetical protein
LHPTVIERNVLFENGTHRGIPLMHHSDVKVDAMGNPATAPPVDKLELYRKLVATNPSVELKGATMPYTSLNGHMFGFLTKRGTLALRLPNEERDAFLKRYKTKLCEQHGTVLEEYVEVPDALLKKTQELKKYFDLSHTPTWPPSNRSRPRRRRGRGGKTA